MDLQTFLSAKAGKESVDEVFMPVVDSYGSDAADKLQTVCEHVASRIAAVINKNQEQTSSATVSEKNSATKSTNLSPLSASSNPKSQNPVR